MTALRQPMLEDLHIRIPEDWGVNHKPTIRSYSACRIDPDDVIVLTCEFAKCTVMVSNANTEAVLTTLEPAET